MTDKEKKVIATVRLELVMGKDDDLSEYDLVEVLSGNTNVQVLEAKVCFTPE